MPLVGAFSVDKQPDDEVSALFTSAAVLDAVATKLGLAAGGVTTLAVQSFQTQVVAGVKYKVKASLSLAAGGERSVTIVAFKPLPHTGNPLEVQEVAAE